VDGHEEIHGGYGFGDSNVDGKKIISIM